MSDEKFRATAIRYEKGKDQAPKLVAKGEGVLAKKIVELAEKHGIPVLEDKNLVNLLFKLEPEEEIPPELYRAVAKILAWVYTRLK